MSTYKTDLYVKQSGNTVLLNPSTFYGKVRIASGVFTAPASGGAAGDKVELVKLPKGARILPESYLYFEAGQGATMTVKVGDAGDDDRFMASATPGANAVKKTFDALLLTGGYVLTEDTVLVMTCGTAAFAADKKVCANIYFVVE